MLSAHYGTFFSSIGDELHVTAHSHHPWPDVTRAAQLQYWEDSARLTNRKWQERVFGQVVPEAQEHVARLLALPDPRLVAFAPNTHEFVARLYSCLDWSRTPHVLTTGNEFHSFSRQTRRLEETGRLAVTRVPAEPYASFRERFHATPTHRYDMVFLSQVFFDSGFVVEGLEELLSRGVARGDRRDRRLSRVHGDPGRPRPSRPADLLHGRRLQVRAGRRGRVLHVDPGGLRAAARVHRVVFRLRPAERCAGRDGGSPRPIIGYGDAAMRFWGSTFDASGLYRFNAVMRWLHDLGITPREIRAHVAGLERRFLAGLADANLALLPVDALTPPARFPRGNFLAFDLDRAEDVERRLAAHGILVDRRGRRIRFGFGVYHDDAFVDRLLERTKAALG